MATNCIPALRAASNPGKESSNTTHSLGSAFSFIAAQRKVIGCGLPEVTSSGPTTASNSDAIPRAPRTRPTFADGAAVASATLRSRLLRWKKKSKKPGISLIFPCASDLYTLSLCSAKVRSSWSVPLGRPSNEKISLLVIPAVCFTKLPISIEKLCPDETIFHASS